MLFTSLFWLPRTCVCRPEFDDDDDDVANDGDDDNVKDDDDAKDNDADKEGDWTERDLHPRHLRPHSYLKLITPPGSSSS